MNSECLKMTGQISTPPPSVLSSKQFKMPYLIRSKGTNQNLQHEAPEA